MEFIYKTTYAYPVFEKIVQSIIDSISERTNIECVIISSYDNYGLAISEINPDESFTDTTAYCGFAKTMYLKNSKANAMVFREEIAASFRDESVKLEEIESKDFDRQSSYHLLLHELGHCIDNINREIVITPFLKNGEFKIRTILNHYFANWACEYYANSFARRYFSGDYTRQSIQGITHDYSVMVKSLEEARVNYRNDLHKHSVSVLNAFHVFMNQFFKYIALANDENTRKELLQISNDYFHFNSFEIKDVEKACSMNVLPDKLFIDILENLEGYGCRFVEYQARNDAMFY